MTDQAVEAWVLEGAKALIGDEMIRADVCLSDGLVSEEPAPAAQRLDASGLLLLPGIVDIHGDAFEHNIMPRPGVAFPLEVALRESDRQILANGITTAYLGLTISWEPGLRSLENARKLVEALERLRPELACDARLHLRWELFALDAEAQVADWLTQTPTPLLAFNDHTSDLFAEGKLLSKLPRMTARSGLSESEYRGRIAELMARSSEVEDAIDRLAAVAREQGAALLAHDETTPEMRRRYRSIGVTTSEFPMNRPTADAAVEAGEHIVLGAPNVLRGGSHNGALNAAEAVAGGYCTVLASDYYYPAPLLAAFKLVGDGVCDLPAAWKLVAENPAIAAGLEDRGRIAPGQRADILLVDASNPTEPQVKAVFVAGQQRLLRV